MLGVVARGQPCLIVDEFNVEPTKILCLSKGSTAGFWVGLEAAWERWVLLLVNAPAGSTGVIAEISCLAFL